jgi:hypothetical protein
MLNATMLPMPLFLGEGRAALRRRTRDGFPVPGAVLPAASGFANQAETAEPRQAVDLRADPDLRPDHQRVGRNRFLNEP